MKKTKTRIELTFSPFHSKMKLWNIKIKIGFIKSILMNSLRFIKSAIYRAYQLEQYIVGWLNLIYLDGKVALNIGLRSKNNLGVNGIKSIQKSIGCEAKNIQTKQNSRCLYLVEASQMLTGRVVSLLLLGVFAGLLSIINGTKQYWSEIIIFARIVVSQKMLMPIIYCQFLRNQNLFLILIMD